MTLFEQILTDLLTENVEVGKVNDAINKTYEVKINYVSDDDNTGSGERIIQPVAYGLTKKGNPVIRAFQPQGDTKTKVPSWKFFRLDRIQSWKPMYRNTFDEPPGMYGADGTYNPNGDGSMSAVYNQAVFGNPLKQQTRKTQVVPVQQQQPKQTATTGPVTKQNAAQQKPQYITAKDNSEVKKLDKLRKQLDNPRYISDIISDKGLNNEPQQQPKLTATSGPVTKQNTIQQQQEIPTMKTPTERDIESRRQQMNKNERVPQSVLDQWNQEQEKRKLNRNGKS